MKTAECWFLFILGLLTGTALGIAIGVVAVLHFAVT